MCGNGLLNVHVVEVAVCVSKTLDTRVTKRHFKWMTLDSPRAGEADGDTVVVNASSLTEWELTFFPIYCKNWTHRNKVRYIWLS